MNPETAYARELYNQFGFLIYRTCLKILRSEDDARDALQSVFLKLLEHYATIKNKEKTLSWIFSAAKNHCYNVLRYNRKFRETAEPDTLPGDDRFEERATAKELVRLAFLNHSKDVRDAVYFTYAESFDQKEIRRMTGQSPATIRRNLKRFKDSVPSIRKRLEMQ